MKPLCPKCGTWKPHQCLVKECPYRQIAQTRTVSLKEEFDGSTPNVFVGQYGYPKVNVGFLGNEGITEEHDSPLLWKARSYSIPKMVGLRTSLVNARFKAGIKSFNDKLLETAREAALSVKPIDYEVKLSKAPKPHLSLAQEAMPYGPSISLKKTRLTSNAKVPKVVEKAVGDTDLKAGEGLGILRKKGLNEHYLTKLFSLGNLGVGKDRKIVPTRWSITAIDDTLGKQKIARIKQYERSEPMLGVGEYQGNNFVVLFFPQEWSYNLIESYKPRHGELHPTMSKDHEFYGGRKNYANETAGGYYAARIGILEYLEKIQKQAGVLVLRAVTDEYWVPLGVWVVREAVRNAMQNIKVLSNVEELMQEAKKTMKNLGVDINVYLQKSELYKERKTQKKLFDY